ncbi:hypothetical protein Bbelb_094300 [Branchiostoma belcheri]|nr:hypothetical protein Bbelb_094300 [Branchiostoma belcheri]
MSSDRRMMRSICTAPLRTQEAGHRIGVPTSQYRHAWTNVNSRSANKLPDPVQRTRHSPTNSLLPCVAVSSWADTVVKRNDDKHHRYIKYRCTLRGTQHVTQHSVCFTHIQNLLTTPKPTN